MSQWGDITFLEWWFIITFSLLMAWITTADFERWFK